MLKIISGLICRLKYVKYFGDALCIKQKKIKKEVNMSGEVSSITTSPITESIRFIPARRATSLVESPRQSTMADKAKKVSSVTLNTSCVVTNIALKMNLSRAPLPPVIVYNMVDNCTEKSKVVVQKGINKIIDSECCYGKEQSWVSRITRWLFG